MHTVFASAGRYTQGFGATRSLPDEMRFLGLEGPVSIISGPTVRALLEPVWSQIFSNAGIDFFLIPFSGECSRSSIAHAVDLVGSQGSEVVLGAGGGKVLDTARAAASSLKLPFVCCPTLASTDSPCSALAIIYSDEGIYEGFDSFGRNPDLVLVDTEVILQGPVRYFIAGMGDALSTMFEARACITSGHPNLRGGRATMAAAEIGELCYRTIMADGRKALEDMKQHKASPAFERVVESNTLLSGIGFESGGLAAAHGLHNAFTVAEGTHGYLHGEKVAFGLLTHLVLESQPLDLFDEVLVFCRDVGLPVTLDGIGLSSDDMSTLQAIANKAMEPGGLIHNEPIEISEDDIVQALLEADRRGRH